MSGRSLQFAPMAVVGVLALFGLAAALFSRVCSPSVYPYSNRMFSEADNRRQF
jgi:hypothetical protein